MNSEIKYTSDMHRRPTRCPFGGDFPNVGSTSCEHCDHYISQTSFVVVCDHKQGQKKGIPNSVNKRT